MKKLMLAIAAALAVASGVALAAMNYVQPSGSAQLTAAAAVSAGDIVTVGDSALVGVAMNSAPSGAVYVAYTTGIFAFANATTNPIAVGATAYRDTTYPGKVKGTGDTNDVPVGVVLGTDANGSVLVDINRP